jgi:cyclopropane-fatty-acyl-phospholipid synthase
VGRATDWARRLQPPDPTLDRDNIQSHYDVSNDFFALMLDETMMYSSAIFERPGMTLAQAQRAKLDRLCTKLGLTASDHVIEIGTGWGGFAVHAAEHYGCRVTTTTISDAQFEYAAKRVADAGLTGRVTVLDRDYRDLTGTYDKLVSIEMIEAVDWRHHDTFFRTCASLLGPDGLMALQAITVDDRSFERAKNGKDFVREFIFPGGCLPSVEAITRSLRRDAPPLVRERRPPAGSGERPRPRCPVPAAVGPLPLLLRRGLRRAPHQRCPDGHGHARVEVGAVGPQLTADPGGGPRTS